MTSWCVGWPQLWRTARPAEGPCFRVSSDVAVRFADAASSSADRRLNIRYPDIVLRDRDPYDVNTVQDHIQLIVEVTSEATVEHRHHGQASPVRRRWGSGISGHPFRQGLGADQRD